ncbi:hypothetical protein ACJ41O_013633 [Fusarium nematophilum]
MAVDDVKTILVLGAGPAAVPIIRQTMVNHVLKRKDLKIVVVSPNTHFHWPVAMPRVVVPGQIPDEKVLVPLAPSFKDYPADKFEWLQGNAVSLNPSSNVVGVDLNGGAGVREVSYHILIIATGTRTLDGGIWKGLGTTEETKSKLHELQSQISKANTIVVAGGGMTGVETAGELGYEYSQHGKKEVIFVYSDDLPLSPPATASVRKQAKTELERLKVQLVPDTTVTGATPKPGSSDIVVELRAKDGSTKTVTAQAYLPATGIVPNTSFVPNALLDSSSFVKQTTRLQAEGYKNIFVVGDVGNLQPSKLMYVESQVTHLINKGLPAYLDGKEVPEYVVNKKEMFAVTIGRSRATGQMGTFKLFSIMIWFLKGRYLGTDYSQQWAAGKRTMSVTFEK